MSEPSERLYRAGFALNATLGREKKFETLNLDAGIVFFALQFRVWQKFTFIGSVLEGGGRHFFFICGK